MKCVDFPQRNVVYAENQVEYAPLPAFRLPNDNEGRVICCWQFTDEEVHEIVKTRVLWHHVLTFNGPLQPQELSTDNPFIERVNHAKDS